MNAQIITRMVLRIVPENLDPLLHLLLPLWLFLMINWTSYACYVWLCAKVDSSIFLVINFLLISTFAFLISVVFQKLFSTTHALIVIMIVFFVIFFSHPHSPWLLTKFTIRLSDPRKLRQKSSELLAKMNERSQRHCTQGKVVKTTHVSVWLWRKKRFGAHAKRFKLNLLPFILDNKTLSRKKPLLVRH